MVCATLAELPKSIDQKNENIIGVAIFNAIKISLFNPNHNLVPLIGLTMWLLEQHENSRTSIQRPNESCYLKYDKAKNAKFQLE